MLGANARPRVAKVVAPVVRGLARIGVTPDMVTVTGTLAAVLGSVLLIATGHLFWGAFVVTLSVLLDMLDGALAWWYSGGGHNRVLVALALVCLVLGVLTSYIKARAEGVGLSCDVGVVERTERLILVLVGTGFTGLGIPYAIDVALWLLLAGSAVTVGQRLVAVHRQAGGRPVPTAPAPPGPPTP